MTRRVVGVTLDNLSDLPKKCRHCVFWELAPHVQEQAAEFGQTDLEKEVWVSSVLLEWGSCGKVAYSEGLPAGYVLYAPPSAVPRAAVLPTGPISADAVLLTALRVRREFTGAGFGRLLVQEVAKDLTGRGVKAIEVFGDAREPNQSGIVGDARPDSESSCVIPADFLLRVGFKTVRPHPRWPRLRLELRTALSWKEDVESALERLLGSVTISARTPAAVVGSG